MAALILLTVAYGFLVHPCRVATFAAGELLEYQVKCGPFRVGSMQLEVLGMESLSGTECYHLAARLELALSPSWLFRARYEQESWCRISDMVTLRYYKRTRESRYEAEWTAYFEPESGRVTYTDGESFDLLPQSRDLLATWYYLRSLELAPGARRPVHAHVDRKNYRATVSVSGRQRTKVPAGSFDCLVVTTTGQSPLGKMLFSSDSRRVPVSIETRVGGLSVTALLQRIRVVGEEMIER